MRRATPTTAVAWRWRPPEVSRSEDGFRCSLHIDSEYARRQLGEHNFDLFLTMQCDKVIDEHGLAVDGDLLARSEPEEDRDYELKGPTGNGTPGGRFESWIRVRRGTVAGPLRNGEKHYGSNKVRGAIEIWSSSKIDGESVKLSRVVADILWVRLRRGVVAADVRDMATPAPPAAS